MIPEMGDQLSEENMPEETESEGTVPEETEGEHQPAETKAGDPPRNDEFKSEASKQSVLADLAKERDARKALEEKFTRLGEALGVDKPETGKTDVEQLTERLAKHEGDLASERSARWRAEVAHEKGLTAKQAARLTGGTRDEFVADADALLDLFPQKNSRFEGSVDAGARKGSSKPSQLTREDMARMSPEEISKAQQEGRCDDLLAGK